MDLNLTQSVQGLILLQPYFKRVWGWNSHSQSWEVTRPRCVQVGCDTPLESFQGELQICFRLHPNRRFEQIVTTSQSPKNPNRDNFGTSPWESRDKKPLGCGCRKEAHSILYEGRWWLPPSSGRGESCESKVARGLS
jgi:hypothetical protein